MQVITEESEVTLTKQAKRNANGIGNIRKRADGRWEARYCVGFDPKTGALIRKSVYCKTQRKRDRNSRRPWRRSTTAAILIPAP